MKPFGLRSSIRVVLVCALAPTLAFCHGEQAGRPPVQSRVSAQTAAAAGSADLLVKVSDGNGDRTTTAAPPAPGVIVRLRGRAAFEAHAAERQRGSSARRALAAAVSQRGTLRGQHGRVLARLAGKLNGLTPRRGRGHVLGASYDDFTDVINGLVLHGVDLASAQRLLADDTEVLSISPVTEVHATLPESVPLIDADDVWALPDANGLAIDGAGMRIGIVDTGVDYTHPDLGGCFGPGCRVAGGYDFVNHDNDPMDDHGHGTHVAATAAGNGTYAGSGGPTPIRGVAPGAQIYAYKVLNSAGSGSSADIIAGIQRCADPDGDGDPADHLDVCSLSLGGGGDPDDAMSVAVDNATATGVVFTIAAGNGGPSASTISSPGTSRRAITVGATCKPSAIGVDSRCAQAIASFSSRGPVVWNTSSGQQTLAKPDLAAPGVSICAAEWGTYQSGSRCLDGRHISISGTSMATPHVAGVAALLRQAHPEWTPDQVKNFLVVGAHDLGLPATAQGSGQVDALDALTLGGLPSNIARVGGTPLRDVDVPTGPFATFTSDLTVTNTTGQSLTFTGSFAGPAGLTATLTPATVSIDPGATATVTVARQVDHDLIASGTEARGTVTLSSAQGDLRVGVQVGVRDRLASAPATADLGVDLASQTSWTAQTTLTLSNLRADVAATYSASIACCDSSLQSGGTWVTASLDQTSVTIGPGGTASLGVTVNVNNPPFLNGRFSGTLTLASPLETLLLPVTFFKGYGLQVDTTPTTPELLTVSSAQSGSQFINPVPAPSLLFLSTTPGPFFVEARWPGGMAPYANYHVLAGNLNTDVPVRAVTLDKAAAVNTWELRPIDQTGAAASSAVIAYRFTHSDSAGGTQGLFGFSGSLLLRVSDVPAGDRFTASVVARSPDPIAWFYDVAGPVSGDQTLTNTPAQLVARDLRLWRPGTGSNTPYLLPWACLMLPFSTPSGGAMLGGGSSCFTVSSAGGPLTGGSATMRFYNQANRDLTTATTPDAASIALEVYDGSATAPMIYRVAHVNVSATHAYSWHIMLPFNGTIRPSEAYSRFLCEESPASGMLPLGVGPLVDQWGWYNHRTDMFAVRPWRGSNLLPFAWGGCLQDMIVTSGSPSYRLFRDGVQVAGGALTSNFFPILSGSDGAHRFELTRGATIAGASTTFESVSTFSVSSSTSIDENPPQLHELHLLGRGLWQEVIDPGVANRLRFTLDPAPGFDAWAQATPPQFTPLADSLTAVGVQQGSDGTTWTDVPVTALGGGVYGTEELDPGPALLWLRINATDAAGNTLRYTFQLPRGTAYAPPGTDVVPPTVALTAPNDGATVFGHVTASATASDDVGVARVDLFVDGARVGSATAAPYVFDWDSGTAPPGPHQLHVRAYDAADNVGRSASVSITVVSATPPTVSLTAPAPGAIVGPAATTVSATTSDDSAVVRVDFLDGGTVVGTAMTPPFSISWHPTTAGTHSLTAWATDRIGRVSTSAAVTVTADLTPPTVALSAPANGSTVQNSVNVSASASDANGIAAVAFYRDGTVLLGTDSTSPYTIVWDTTTTPAGAHSLTAVARDNAGNSANSSARTVTVKDVTAPVVAITAPASGARVPVNSVVTIAATASDLNGVVRVDFYVAGKVKCSDTSSPYTCAWTVPPATNKSYTLQAKALDAAGNTGSSPTVTVTSR